MVPEWRQHYVRYNHLKQMLKDIVARSKETGASFVAGDGSNAESGAAGAVPFTPPKNLAQLSLTFRERRPGDSSGAGAAVSETAFFEALDDDMDKVRAFVQVGLERLRDAVGGLAAEVDEAVRWVRGRVGAWGGGEALAREKGEVGGIRGVRGRGWVGWEKQRDHEITAFFIY